MQQSARVYVEHWMTPDDIVHRAKIISALLPGGVVVRVFVEGRGESDVPIGQLSSCLRRWFPQKFKKRSY